MRDVGDRHQDPALGPEQHSRVTERRPGVDKVLEHVAEDHRVERLGLEVLRERAGVDVRDDQLVEDLAGRLGGLGVDVHAAHPAASVREDLGGVTGGAPDVQDGLVAPDERDQLGLAVVGVVQIDRGLVAGHMLSVVLARPKRAGLKAPSWARELALNSTSGRVGNRPWRDVADGPGPGGPDQDSAATGGPWCETPSRGCPGPTASDSAAARGDDEIRAGRRYSRDGFIPPSSHPGVPPSRLHAPGPEVSVRRAVFYLFFDPQGQVDDYVLHTLEHLRPHADLVFVVSNIAARRGQPRPPRVCGRHGVGPGELSVSTSGPTRSRWSRSAPRSSRPTTRCCMLNSTVLRAGRQLRRAVRRDGRPRRHRLLGDHRPRADAPAPGREGPAARPLTSRPTGSRAAGACSPHRTGRSTGRRCR